MLIIYLIRESGARCQTLTAMMISHIVPQSLAYEKQLKMSTFFIAEDKDWHINVTTKPPQSQHSLNELIQNNLLINRFIEIGNYCQEILFTQPGHALHLSPFELFWCIHLSWRKCC